MFCSNCGKEIADGVKFCTNCGKAVNDAAPVAAMTNVSVHKSSMDVRGLVLGIITIIIDALTGGAKANGVTALFLMPLIIAAIPLGIAGVVVSAIALSRNKKASQPTGMAIAGLVVSIFSVVLFFC